jgi:hypothetical protein
MRKKKIKDFLKVICRKGYLELDDMNILIELYGQVYGHRQVEMYEVKKQSDMMVQKLFKYIC